MEGSLILERLDSVWFFSNLFSLRSNQPAFDVFREELEDPTKPNRGQQNDLTEAEFLPPIKPSTESAETESLLCLEVPIKPIVQTQQNESLKTESLLKCGEFCGETESELTESTESYIFSAVEGIILQEENSTKALQRSRRKRKIKRKVLGELNLGFDDENYDIWEMKYKANYGCGFGMFGGQNLVKMPPLSDGLAMKEHLKSWAYAVACTVR